MEQPSGMRGVAAAVPITVGHRVCHSAFVRSFVLEHKPYERDERRASKTRHSFPNASLPPSFAADARRGDATSGISINLRIS